MDAEDALDPADGDEELEMGDEELEMGGEEDLEEAMDEVEEALSAADVSLEEELNEDDFLNEVTKRVAKRLLSLSKNG